MSKSRLGSLAANTLLALVSTAVFLLLGEGIYRTLQHFGLAETLTRSSIGSDSQATRTWNAKLVPSKNPVLFLEYDTSNPAINSTGFRDREFSLERRARTRIAVIGDSVTFGLGVASEDTYVKRIEAALNAADGAGERAEVMNFGVSGYGTEAELELYKTKVRQFAPDIVVLGYVINDPIPPTRLIQAVKTEMMQSAAFGRRAKLSQLWALFELKYRQATRALQARSMYADVYDPKGEYWGKVESSFEEFSRLGKQDGFELLVVVFPMLYRFDAYPLAAMHAQVHESLDRHGIRYIDLLPDFAQVEPSALRLADDDATHPSPLGHRIAADVVVRYLQQSGWLR